MPYIKFIYNFYKNKKKILHSFFVLSIFIVLFYKNYFLVKRAKLVYLVAPAACRSVNLLRFFQS